MASTSTPRILIVDDDADVAEVLCSALAGAGYHCKLALSGSAALRELEHGQFDAIISDWCMDGMSGLQLLEALQRERPKIPVIVIGGLVGGSASDAIDHGAFHHLTQPIDIEELRGVIEQAIGDRARVRDLGRHDALLPIGAATRALLSRIDLLASAQCPVLIQGESGTGKELVARAIHDRGPRAGAPFIAVNTAAIPDQLLESELFGHVRGAFSGATQLRRGLLTEANHGTVLLDEIGDMPLGLQAKLLRVIQFGEVRAIGSDRSHFLDLRFLAATHRNLSELVKQGKFREDLYFRLNVIELDVPALRDRRSEIPALIAHFLAQAREKKPDSPVRCLSPDAVRVLTEAPWPGNIRQLSSTIERLVIFGQTSDVSSADLSLVELGGRSPFEAPLAQAERGLWSLEQLSRHYTDWVLAHTKNDKVRTAQILGINLSTLYRWLPKRSASTEDALVRAPITPVAAGRSLRERPGPHPRERW
jgi:two-component system response regulator HydG